MKGLRARLIEQATASKSGDTDSWVARDYYQSVIDSVASVICTVDRDLRITGVNRPWDEFARGNYGEGFTSEHILGTPILSLMKGPLLKRWQKVCPQILSGQTPLYLDEVIVDKPIVWHHYTLAASPLKDNQGEILGITFVATNIGQLKKAEAEMWKRVVEMRGLHQVAQVAGAWFDRRAFHRQVTADIAHVFGADKCIIFRWGEGSGHLQAQAPAFGLSGRELMDLSLDIGDPDDPASLWQDLEEQDYILLNEGDEAPDSMVEASARVDRLAAMMGVLRVSGRVHGTILVAGRDRPFSEQDGQLMAALAVPIVLAIEDAELNRRLLDRVRQLTAVREELGRITKIAESIRKPLTVIRGYIELLLDGALGPVPEGQSPTLNMLFEKSRELARAVNQLLPSQFLPDATHYEPVHLGDLARKVRDKWIASVRLAGLDLVIQPPMTESERFVTAGDPSTLFNVFTALLDNAVKYSPNGGTIHISLHEAGEITYVKVSDPGVGFPPHRVLDIWQPKARKEHSDSISLAEVKQVVEGYGGQVWAESRPDRGSTFYVVLPKMASK